MAEKAFIMLFVLFVMLGILAYDRSLTEDGQVSIVGQLIDFAGLGDYSSPDDGVSVTRRSFHYRLEHRLPLLQERLQQMEDVRTRLSNGRQRILEQMTEVNEQIEDEAMAYDRILEEERELFSDRFPEIETLGQGLTATDPDPMNTEERRKHVQSLRNRLFRFLEESVQEPETAMEQFKPILQDLEAFYLDEESPIPGECGKDEDCLPQHINRIARELAELLRKERGEIDQDIQDLESVLKLAQREFRILANNYEMREEHLKVNSRRIEIEMKRLSDELVTVTEEDMRALMDLYHEMVFEQRSIMENLSLNRMRLREAYNKSDKVIKDVFNRRNLAKKARNPGWYMKLAADRRSAMDEFDDLSRKIAHSLKPLPDHYTVGKKMARQPSSAVKGPQRQRDPLRADLLHYDPLRVRSSWAASSSDNVDTQMQRLRDKTRQHVH